MEQKGGKSKSRPGFSNFTGFCFRNERVSPRDKEQKRWRGGRTPFGERGETVTAIRNPRRVWKGSCQNIAFSKLEVCCYCWGFVPLFLSKHKSWSATRTVSIQEFIRYRHVITIYNFRRKLGPNM